MTPLSGGEAEQVNDSPVIAERLLDMIDAAKLTSVPKSKDFRSDKAMEWAQWSDSKLAVLLFPNITRSYAEAFEAFGYVQSVPHFSYVDKLSNQLVGSLAMWLVSFLPFSEPPRMCSFGRHARPVTCRIAHACANGRRPKARSKRSTPSTTSAQPCALHSRIGWMRAWAASHMPVVTLPILGMCAFTAV